MNVLILAVLLTQQAPLPPQAPPIPVERSSYENARAIALDQRIPFVIFVNQESRQLRGMSVIETKSLHYPGEPRPIHDGIILHVPENGKLWKVRVLPHDTPDATIRFIAANPWPQEEVQPILASPFRQGSLLDLLRQRRGEVRTADGDDPLRSLWRDAPDLADYIATLERYETATQIQKTGRRWSGVIEPVSRTTIESKWSVPGHLDGVQGWSSTLYRTRGRPFVGLIRQDASDMNSAITFNRDYPDGTVFSDVLRNENGRVFAVRMSEKSDGRWTRFTAYRNKLVEPHGYVPPKNKQCAECHNQAGRSEYGAGAVPGGDTILSDSFPHLEAGQSVQGGFGLQL